MGSPRGWQDDDLEDGGAGVTQSERRQRDCESERRQRDCEGATTVRDARASTVSAGPEGATESMSAEAVRRVNAQLVKDLTDARVNEEILTRELRRLRREYDSAVQAAQAQQQARQLPVVDAQGSSAQSASSATEKVVAVSALTNAGKARELNALVAEQAKEIERLRESLDQSWKECQDLRASKRRDVEELREIITKDAEHIAWKDKENAIMIEKLLDADQKMSQLQMKAAQMEDLVKKADGSFERIAAERRETINQMQRERKESEARFSDELKAMRAQLAETSTTLHALSSKREEEVSKHEREMYEQFTAYRELWKKNTDAFKSLNGLVSRLREALQPWMPDDEESKQGVEESDSSAEAVDVRVIVEAVLSLKAQFESERKHREVAERNMKIGQKRLNRAQTHIDELRATSSASSDNEGVAWKDYERIWQEMQRSKSKLKVDKKTLSTGFRTLSHSSKVKSLLPSRSAKTVLTTTDRSNVTAWRLGSGGGTGDCNGNNNVATISQTRSAASFPEI